MPHRLDGPFHSSTSSDTQTRAPRYPSYWPGLISNLQSDVFQNKSHLCPATAQSPHISINIGMNKTFFFLKHRAGRKVGTTTRRTKERWVSVEQSELADIGLQVWRMCRWVHPWEEHRSHCKRRPFDIADININRENCNNQWLHIASKTRKRKKISGLDAAKIQTKSKQFIVLTQI